MEFTPEQLTAINTEVARQLSAAISAQTSQLAFMQKQHDNALELQVSSQNAAAAGQAAQAAANAEMQAKQAKLSAVQLAQNTLIANRNNQPVDAREVSAADITAYADTLVNYINS